MDFVAEGNIKIRSGTDQWGPFGFDLTRGIPPGDTLNSAVVKSYLGSVETTSSLIEAGSTSVVGSIVRVKFQYPGTPLIGKHVLEIHATCVSGATFPYEFAYVIVE